MFSWSEELSNGFLLTALLMLVSGVALTGIWAAIITGNSGAVIQFIGPYVHLGDMFSPLVVGLAMVMSGIGLLMRRRFGFVLAAYTLTVWSLLSVIAVFGSSLEQSFIALLNITVFGGALYHFLQRKHIFIQDMPEVLHAVSFLMFLGGWLGMSFAVNHIIYSTTLHIALLLGGSLLMVEGSVGLAAKSRIGLWFSIAVLMGAIVFESAFMLLDGGSQYLYRITLSTVGVYYLYAHREMFY